MRGSFDTGSFRMNNIDNELERLRLSSEQENEMFRIINSISVDYTVFYDCTSGSAIITKYSSQGEEKREVISLLALLRERVHSDDSAALEKEIASVKRKVSKVSLELRLKEGTGRRYRWHSVNLRLISRPEGDCYVGCTRLIDTRKNKENELTIKARQDPLTGLLNKTVTRENVSTYLENNPESTGAMIILDIDNFKYFNDCCGHLFGDEVIIEVANHLRRIFGAIAFTGRVGGDEFLVYIRNIPELTELFNLMIQLRESLENISLGRRTGTKITVSVGVSLFPDMGADFDSLFSKADMALYSIKNSGKNNFAIYTDDFFDENATTKSEDNILGSAINNEAESYSIIDFAFKLLNESADYEGSVNLLLYKMMNEFNLECVYVNELADNEMKIKCTYECCKELYPSKRGEEFVFSYEAWRRTIDELEPQGYRVIDVRNDENAFPGNDLEKMEGVGSVLQVNMRLFAQSQGCINLASRFGRAIWTPKRVASIHSVVNLISIILYYAKRVREADEEVERFTEYDPLTGLMKEEHFIEAVNDAVRMYGETSKLAVVYCDISNFKFINETYGYTTGDGLLREMGRYLTNMIPNVICAGRMYSDNLLCVAKFDIEKSEADILAEIDSYSKKLNRHLQSSENLLNLSTRAGVYIIPGRDSDTLEAISNANLARKMAKKDGQSGVVMFSREMFEKRRAQIQMVQELDSAMLNEEFEVYLQPKVSVGENKLQGAEALVRWMKPDGTTLLPNDFIPALEKDGSITKLDFYVYEHVMRYLKNRIDEGKRNVPISMNVSRKHLDSFDFVEKFVALRDKYEIPNELIELEITETVYLENMSIATEVIEELKARGISVSMDDFGSGYSSLNALNDLKFDLIKIDRMFLQNAEESDSRKNIIRFIINLAKSLCVDVLCEGVETKEQKDFLSEAGCNLQQGFLFSKPVDSKTFDSYIDDENLLFAKIS